MSRIPITSTNMFDGTSDTVFPGEMLSEGPRIGATLIAGFTEAHLHLGFGSSVDRITIRRDLSPTSAHCLPPMNEGEERKYLLF